MAVAKFDKRELEVVQTVPGVNGAPDTDVYSFPVTPKEACRALYERKPIWQTTGVEQKIFNPKINPDNIARAFVLDASDIPMMTGGGPDMFGIEWEFIPQVGGSMVRPGKPFAGDANEIAGKIVWPDIEKWDWEGAAKYNADFLNEPKFISGWIMNGWYERLISFMDFENAIMALFDEDQKDAVHAFFDQLSDLYIKIIDKTLTYFPQVDVFSIHDDWGSQKETFFSPEVAEEMIVPYMKRVNDYIHSRGRFADLHSCGMGLKQVPNFIAAGWDSWIPQLMNDTQKIYELYGDKILISVAPDAADMSTLPEAEQRALARDYADKFCDPKKPSRFNSYSNSMLTKAFREELYIRSRENYSK